MKHAVIIGSGLGGLSSAVRLSQRGWKVTVVEARSTPGGLASSTTMEELQFDVGPYILLDRPGLEWAFSQVGVDIAEQFNLRRVEDFYSTEIDGQTFTLFQSLDQTANAIERNWPGNAAKYRSLVEKTYATYKRLQPLQCMPRPTPWDVVRAGAWRDIPFLFRSLNSVFQAANLHPGLIRALAIWTLGLGQSIETAPSPLALVPAVIHKVGAWYPEGGIGRIPDTLFKLATDLGVEFQLDTQVTKVLCDEHGAKGVATNSGNDILGDVVISNIGLKTYVDLLDENGAAAIPTNKRQEFKKLPLQCPGICVYLAVKGKRATPYLRFNLRDELDGCRLIVDPSTLEDSVDENAWRPARLIVPMHQDRAEPGGEAAQRELLERVLAETWWRDQFDEDRVLTTRIPKEWGSNFHLHRDSMNPVMTAAFMRSGRIAHRSPWIKNLYMTGSATHPGQWVSFCAVSGILCADAVLRYSR